MPKFDGKLLLTEALIKHWRQYRKRLRACRHNANEDNVHELRISSRRLLSLIQLLAILDPQATLNKIRKTLKAQLDGFDELRDVQVMLFEAAKTLPLLPELEPFLADLHRREQQLQRQNLSFIAGLYQPKLGRKIKKTGKRLTTVMVDTELHSALTEAVDQIYATAISRYQALDCADLASIHHLRIAVKKLRYSLLSLQPMLCSLPEGYLKRLQSYATRMGEIQNSVVLLQTLERFFEHNVPTAILTHYRQGQQTLVASFMAQSAELLEFGEERPGIVAMK